MESLESDLVRRFGKFGKFGIRFGLKKFSIVISALSGSLRFFFFFYFPVSIPPACLLGSHNLKSLSMSQLVRLVFKPNGQGYTEARDILNERRHGTVWTVSTTQADLFQEDLEESLISRWGELVDMLSESRNLVDFKKLTEGIPLGTSSPEVNHWYSQSSSQSVQKIRSSQTYHHLAPYELLRDDQNVQESHSVFILILQVEHLVRADGSSCLHLHSPSNLRFSALFEWPLFEWPLAPRPTVHGQCGVPAGSSCRLTLSRSILISSDQANLFELSCLTHPTFCFRWLFFLPRSSIQSILFTPVLTDSNPNFNLKFKIFHLSSFHSHCDLRSFSRPVVSQPKQVFFKEKDWMLLSVVRFLNHCDQYRLSRANRMLYQTVSSLALHHFIRTTTDMPASPLSHSSISHPWAFLWNDPQGNKMSFESAYEHFELERCPDSKRYLETFLNWAEKEHNLDLRLPSAASATEDLKLPSAASVSGTEDLRLPSAASATEDLKLPSAASVSGTEDLKLPSAASEDLRLSSAASVSGTEDLRLSSAASVSGTEDLKLSSAASVSGTEDLKLSSAASVSGMEDLKLSSAASVSRALAASSASAPEWRVYRWSIRDNKFITETGFYLFSSRLLRAWACLFPRRAKPWSRLVRAIRPGFCEQLATMFPKPTNLPPYQNRVWAQYVMWRVLYFGFTEASLHSKALKDEICSEFKLGSRNSFLLNFIQQAMHKTTCRVQCFLLYLTKRFEISAALKGGSLAKLLRAYLFEFKHLPKPVPPVPSWMDMFVLYLKRNVDEEAEKEEEEEVKAEEEEEPKAKEEKEEETKEEEPKAEAEEIKAEEEEEAKAEEKREERKEEVKAEDEEEEKEEDIIAEEEEEAKAEEEKEEETKEEEEEEEEKEKEEERGSLRKKKSRTRLLTCCQTKRRKR